MAIASGITLAIDTGGPSSSGDPAILARGSVTSYPSLVADDLRSYVAWAASGRLFLRELEPDGRALPTKLLDSTGIVQLTTVAGAGSTAWRTSGAGVASLPAVPVALRMASSPDGRAWTVGRPVTSVGERPIFPVLGVAGSRVFLLYHSTGDSSLLLRTGAGCNLLTRSWSARAVPTRPVGQAEAVQREGSNFTRSGIPAGRATSAPSKR